MNHKLTRFAFALSIGLFLSALLFLNPLSAFSIMPSQSTSHSMETGMNMRRIDLVSATKSLSTSHTTIHDFFLPGTQPNQLNASIPTPTQCQLCHTEPIYEKWRGSMMGQAGRDPLMWAALYVANNDSPEAGEYCLRCHTPKGWLEGRSQPTDGSALLSEDIESGVACEVCHRMVDPIPSENDQTVEIDEPIRNAIDPALPLNHIGSAMMIIDPDDNRRGPFQMSNRYHTAYRSDFLSQVGSHETRSRLCGTCHNLDNPTLSWDSERNQYWPNEVDTPPENFSKGELFPVERTYDEWLNSDYARKGVYAPQFAGDKPDGIVATCQDCHMPRSTGMAALPILGATQRNCTTTGCLPVHELVGGNTWVPGLLQDTRWRLHNADDASTLDHTIVSARQMLEKAATMTVTLSMSETNKIATVRVTNETGHKLPTGYPEGRRMWINLQAFNAQGQVIDESGAYNLETGVLTLDAGIKIYETKHGLTPELASTLDLPAGESFHFVLNNVILKDNRIPPRGYTQAAYAQRGLEPVGATYADGQHWDETIYNLPIETTSVTAKLYYQTSSKEYIDFLRENGGPDGIVLGQMWDDSKSPPELMATTSQQNSTLMLYLPLLFR